MHTAHNDLHRNRGFSPWLLLLGTPTDKSVCEKSRSGSVQCRGRVEQSEYRRGAVTSKTSQRNSSSPTLEALGEWCWYWRSGKHKGSRMKGGVFLGPACVLLQERETAAEGVRMQGCCLDHRGCLSCSMCCTAPTFPFRVREKIVQHRGHRIHQFPRPCQTFAAWHISISHDTDRCS